MKQCTTCLEFKPEEHFHWHYTDKGIRRHTCNVCRSNVEKLRQQTDSYKVKRTDYSLRKAYGISSEEYQEKLKQQNYVCAICNKEKTTRALAVDHCHVTGIIRSLLCGSCNTGLGHFKDSPELLNKAADYIKEHNGT